MLGRGRFRDLVKRQLDLFERDEAGEIAEVHARLAAYNAADRDEAEELYGDYMDHVDALKELAEELRDTYGRTLDDDAREIYEREFDRVLAKRGSRLGL